MLPFPWHWITLFQDRSPDHYTFWLLCIIILDVKWLRMKQSFLTSFNSISTTGDVIEKIENKEPRWLQHHANSEWCVERSGFNNAENEYFNSLNFTLSRENSVTFLKEIVWQCANNDSISCYGAEQYIEMLSFAHIWILTCQALEAMVKWANHRLVWNSTCLIKELNIQ